MAKGEGDTSDFVKFVSNAWRAVRGIETNIVTNTGRDQVIDGLSEVLGEDLRDPGVRSRLRDEVVASGADNKHRN